MTTVAELKNDPAALREMITSSDFPSDHERSATIAKFASDNADFQNHSFAHALSEIGIHSSDSLLMVIGMIIGLSWFVSLTMKTVKLRRSALVNKASLIRAKETLYGREDRAQQPQTKEQ